MKSSIKRKIKQIHLLSGLSLLFALGLVFSAYVFSMHQVAGNEHTESPIAININDISVNYSISVEAGDLNNSVSSITPTNCQNPNNILDCSFTDSLFVANSIGRSTGSVDMDIFTIPAEDAPVTSSHYNLYPDLVVEDGFAVHGNTNAKFEPISASSFVGSVFSEIRTDLYFSFLLDDLNEEYTTVSVNFLQTNAQEFPGNSTPLSLLSFALYKNGVELASWSLNPNEILTEGAGTFGSAGYPGVTVFLNPEADAQYHAKIVIGAGGEFNDFIDNIYSVDSEFRYEMWLNIEDSPTTETVETTGGIGWISFNCLDDNICNSSDYKVTVNPDTGALVGHAWANPGDGMDNTSGSYGWIKFGGLSGFPPNGDDAGVENVDAYIDLDGGDNDALPVKGWARILSADHNQSGGWDGWIALSGNWEDGVTFNKDTGQFSGFAWGGPHVGWISFNPPANDEGVGMYDAELCLGIEGFFDFSMSSPPKTMTEGDIDSPHVITISTVPESTFAEPVDIQITSINSPFGATSINVSLSPDADSCDPGLSSPANCLISLSITAPEGSSLASEPEGTEHIVNFTGISPEAANTPQNGSFVVTVLPVVGPGNFECRPEPSSLGIVGFPVNWTVDEVPDADSYEWSGNPDPIGGWGSCSDNICSKAYSTTGVKTASVKPYGTNTEGDPIPLTDDEIECENATIIAIPEFWQF